VEWEKPGLRWAFLGEEMGCGGEINCGDYKKGFQIRQTA
jgi:hypothetical protein